MSFISFILFLSFIVYIFFSFSSLPFFSFLLSASFSLLLLIPISFIFFHLFLRMIVVFFFVFLSSFFKIIHFHLRNLFWSAILSFWFFGFNSMTKIQLFCCLLTRFYWTWPQMKLSCSFSYNSFFGCLRLFDYLRFLYHFLSLFIFSFSFIAAFHHSMNILFSSFFSSVPLPPPSLYKFLTSTLSIPLCDLHFISFFKIPFKCHSFYLFPLPWLSSYVFNYAFVHLLSVNKIFWFLQQKLQVFPSFLITQNHNSFLQFASNEHQQERLLGASLTIFITHPRSSK